MNASSQTKASNSSQAILDCVRGQWKRPHVRKCVVAFPIGSVTSVAKKCQQKARQCTNHSRSKGQNEENEAQHVTLSNNDATPCLCAQSELEGIVVRAVSRSPVDLDDDRELEQSLAKYYHEEFSQFLLNQCEAHLVAESYLEIVLRASTHLVDELLKACQEIEAKGDANIAERRIITTAQQQLELYLEPHIFWMGTAETTTPSEAAAVILWVERYFDSIKQSLCTPLSELLRQTSRWNEHIEQLLELYLERGVRLAMKECLATGLKLQGEDNVMETRKGTLITGQPTEIAYLYNMQLSVAKDNLPSHYLGQIVAACNQEVRDLVSQAMMQVGTEWKNMSVERLCSVINDAAKLSDDCEERNELYLEQEEKGKELCRDWMELALFATRQLCERILMDMHQASEPILSTIGTSQWLLLDQQQHNSTSAVQRTHATLSDYFADLQVWLPEYFFPKVLKHCLDLTLERYVEAFFGNTLDKGTRNAKLAAAALRRDFGDFCSFWNTGVSAKYHGKAGFYTPQALHQRFHLLMSFTFLLTPNYQPNDVEEEIETVLQELGSDAGVPAVLHLVGLGKRRTAQESWQWHETISQVVHRIQGNNEQRVRYKYKLPDLRNSRFLQNIQPPPPPSNPESLLSSGNDNDQQQHLKQTGALVKKRNLQRLRWMAHERVRNFIRS